MRQSLLTVAEVAAELRLRPETVRRYIASGELVAHRFGRDYRVTPGALATFMQSTLTVDETT